MLIVDQVVKSDIANMTVPSSEISRRTSFAESVAMLATWLATVLTVNVVPTGGMVLEGVHRPLALGLVSAKVMLWTENMR
jgi:hypothetical protein